MDLQSLKSDLTGALDVAKCQVAKLEEIIQMLTAMDVTCVGSDSDSVICTNKTKHPTPISDVTGTRTPKKYKHSELRHMLAFDEPDMSTTGMNDECSTLKPSSQKSDADKFKEGCHPHWKLTVRQKRVLKYVVNDDPQQQGCIIADIWKGRWARRDFATLIGNQWLSDLVMEIWCAYLNACERDVPAGSKCHYHTVAHSSAPHIFSSDPNSEFSVGAAITNLQLDSKILDYSWLVFPVVSNGHWRVYAVDLDNRAMTVMDSLRTDAKASKEITGGLVVATNLIKNVRKTVERLHLEQGSDRPKGRWDMFQNDSCPQQTNRADVNSYDCGIFAMKYMKHWDGSSFNASIVQGDMGFYRQQIAVEIVSSQHNRVRNYCPADVGFVIHDAARYLLDRKLEGSS